MQCAELLIINKQEYTIWEMLMNILRSYVKETILETFYGKNKKTIDFLIIFYISHKSGIRTFLK